MEDENTELEYLKTRVWELECENDGLQDRVDELEQALAHAESDRDDYSDELQELTERNRTMTSAASSAAATAVAAISRLEVMQAVVSAAEKFIDDPHSVNTFFALGEAVARWTEVKPS